MYSASYVVVSSFMKMSLGYGFSISIEKIDYYVIIYSWWATTNSDCDSFSGLISSYRESNLLDATSCYSDATFLRRSIIYKLNLMSGLTTEK